MCLVLIRLLSIKRWLTDSFLWHSLSPLTPWWMAIPIIISQAQTHSGACGNSWSLGEGKLVLPQFLPCITHRPTHLWRVAQRNAWLGPGLTSLISGLSGDGESLLLLASSVSPGVCVCVQMGKFSSVGKVFEHQCSFLAVGIEEFKHLSRWGTWVYSEIKNEQHSWSPYTKRNCQIQNI